MQAIGRYFLKGAEIAATEELLSVPEVGDRLGVSVYTVRRWIKSGDLLAYRPGKEYRVRESDLEKFLEAHRPKVAAPPSPEAPDEGERRLRYLHVLETFATSMESQWSAKVQGGVFSEEEFDDGVAVLTDFEGAYVKGVGIDLLAALRAYEGSLSDDFPEAKAIELRARALSLPEAELEALISTKDALDAWHLTLWHAYDALKERDAANVVKLDNWRKRLQAAESKALEESEQASGV